MDTTVGSFRRGIGLTLVVALLLSLTAWQDPARADELDRAELEAVSAAIGVGLLGLTGVELDALAAEAVPLTPATLDQVLSLSAVLPALGARLQDALVGPDALGDLDALLEVLEGDGLALPDGTLPDTNAVLTGERIGNSRLELTLSATRSVSSPLIALTDLVAYDTGSLPIEGTAAATFELDWDPTTLLTTGLDDVTLQLTELTLGAEVAGAFEALPVTVGILRVVGSGTASGSFSLSAVPDAAPRDLLDWANTPGRDRFTLRLGSGDPNAPGARAALDLELSLAADSLLGGDTSALTGRVALDWAAGGGPLSGDPAGWLDPANLEVELDGFAPFRRLLVEEVIAAVAQLAVTLRATQLSGAADAQLPFLRERLSDVVDLGQGILDWLAAQRTADGRALARFDDSGELVSFLEELDRSLLIELGLTDVETILASVQQTLPAGLPLDLAYDAAAEELTFDLGWSLSDVADTDLTFNARDTFEASVGLADLRADAAVDLELEADVSAALAVSVDLRFDEVRDLLATYDFDLEAFRADAAIHGLDVADVIGITDRVAFDVGRTGVDLDVTLRGGFDLAGSVGFLGVTATADGFVLGSGSDDPALRLRFANGDADRITLSEVFDRMRAPSLPSVVPTFSLGVQPFDIEVAGRVGASSPLSGAVAVAWPDILDPATLSIDAGLDWDQLLAFRFSGDPFELLRLLLDAFDGVVAALQSDLLRNSLLSDALPFAEVDIADLVAELGTVRDQLGILATDPAGTLQGVGDQLNALLVGAFRDAGADVPSGTTFVTLGVDEYDAGEGDRRVVRLTFELGVCGTLTGATRPAGCVLDRALEVPFALDLDDLLPPGAEAIGSVVGLDASGRLGVGYDVGVKLDVGVLLPQVSIDAGVTVTDREDPTQLEARFAVDGEPPALLVYPETGIAGSLELQGEVQLELALGPVTLAAGRDGDPGLLQLAPSFSFALEGDGPRVVGVDGSGLGALVSGFAFSFGGGGGAVCPAPLSRAGLEDGEETGDAADGAEVPADGDEVPTADAEVPPAGDEDPDATVGDDEAATTGDEGTVTTGDDELPTSGDAGSTTTAADDDPPASSNAPHLPRDPAATVSGDACGLLPLYARNRWVGDLGLLVGDLTDTASWELTVPPDLLDELASSLLDWTLLLDGLRQVLRLVATALDGANQGVRVPVVGEVLDGGANVAADIEAALGQLATTLEQFDDAGELRAGLQAALDGALGGILDDVADGSPIVIDLLCGVDGDPCADDAPIGTVLGAEVSLRLGQRLEAELPGFDLGFPGLKLTVYDDVVDADGNAVPGGGRLTAGVAWSVDLTVGLDRTGFYLVTADESGVYKDQLSLSTDVRLPQRLSGDLALLRVDLERLTEAQYGTVTGGLSRPTIASDDGPVDRDLQLTVAAQVRAGASTGRVTLPELVRDASRQTFVLGVDANVGLGYGLRTSVQLPGVDSGDEVFPTLAGSLVLAWSFDADTSGGFSFDTEALQPDKLGIYGVSVDLGEFFSGFLGPILSEVQRFTRPFQPVIDTISTPIPGLSDLSVAIGGPEITMLTLFEVASGADLTFIKRIISLVQLINSLPSDGAIAISLGDLELDFSRLRDTALPASQRSSLIANLGQLRSQLDTGDGVFSRPEFTSAGGGQAATSVTRARTGGGVSFPAFQQPSNLMSLLVGQDVTLVRWDSGTLSAGFGVSYSFPPIFIGPVPVGFSLSASAQIAGRFAVGYDTYGIRRAVDRWTSASGGDVENVLGGIGLLFNGLFLDDLDAAGNDVPEIILTASFAAGAGISIGVASAGLELGLRATIDFDLRDPSGTGRIRAADVFQLLRTPICLFEVGGQLEVFLNAYLKVLFTSFDFQIFAFTILRVNDIFSALCGPRPPNLADVLEVPGGRVLVLNAGARGNLRGVGIDPSTMQPETDESFTVRPLNDANTAFSVAAFGEYEEFTGITGVVVDGRRIKVVGDGGSGDDTLQFLDGVRTDQTVDGIIEDPDAPIPATTIAASASVAFCGGAGDDVIIGGRGDDLLLGDGVCTATGGGGLSLDPVERGTDGADRVSASGGDNVMIGGGGRDQLYGGPGDDVLAGGSGNDLLYGSSGPGGTGDVLIGGVLLRVDGVATRGSVLGVSPTATGVSSPGDDQLFGGDGHDVLLGDNGAVATDGDVLVDERSGGDDLLDGGPGDDRLFGGPGADELYGGRGDDLLDGGAGADLLVGGSPGDDGQPGSNVLVGGGGDDTLVAHDARVDRADDGSWSRAVPIDGASAAPAVLVGGALRVVGDPGDDTLWGGPGGDLLFGDHVTPVGAAAGLATTTVAVTGGLLARIPLGLGGPRSDGRGPVDVLGTRDADGYPTALAPAGTAGGDDRLHGMAGDDTLLGGPGHDVLVGGVPGRTTPGGRGVGGIDPGADLLIGGPGDDLLAGDHAEVGASGVGAAVEAVALQGAGSGSNRLLGGTWRTGPDATADPGSDVLLGGRNGDVLVGDDGTISGDGSRAADRTVTVLLAAGGDDRLDGGPGPDRLFGGPGDDLLRGIAGDNHLEGGPGDDELVGGRGDDILLGGSSRPGVPSGDDLIVGGGGSSVLAGDNARIERAPSGAGVHSSDYLVELFDLPIAGAGEQPDAATAGDDVLVGGVLTGRSQTDALVFGQGGDDLLIGDDARRVAADSPLRVPFGELVDSARWGTVVPLETGVGGDDTLVGGPGDDRLFGGPGLDALIGGSSVHTPVDDDRAVPDDLQVHVVPPPLSRTEAADATAAPTPLEGTVAGDDLLVGGPGNDLLAGDNARVERVAHGVGVDGGPFLLERYDVAVAGRPAPDTGTGGADVLVGGSLAVPTTSSDTLVGQGGDDLLLGDGAVRAADGDPLLARYGGLSTNGRWGAFVPLDGDGASGGADRLEGDAGDDALFGGPGDDLVLGGADRDWDLASLDAALAGDGIDAEAARGAERSRAGTVTVGGTGRDVLVGGAGHDHLFGDNARVDVLAGGTGASTSGVSSRRVAATLADVAIAGSPSPHPATAGDDVLVGGRLGLADDDLGAAGDDAAFGQGGDDLLLGDHAVLLADDRFAAPLRGGGGGDHLEGNAGDDVLFGGDGDDLLLGGSSDRAVPDAADLGLVSGDDLALGGAGSDVVLGDNGRLCPQPRGAGGCELPDGSRWWEDRGPSGPLTRWWNPRGGTQLAGALVEPFDELLLADDLAGTLPHVLTAGDDLLLGGSLRAGLSTIDAIAQASATGLEGPQPTGAARADGPGDDLLHGQAGDDVVLGDDALVRLDLLGGWVGDTPAAAWGTIRRELADVLDGPRSTWPLASLDRVDGDAAAGGDDLAFGGAGDDVLFGGPGQDDLLGGSWDAGRLDGRDLVDGGPGHDVVAGDNARISRPLDGDRVVCLTSRHRDTPAFAWDAAVAGGDGVTPCLLGVADPDPSAGVVTRVERVIAMVDDDPNVDEDGVSRTAGSDILLGAEGDDTLIGQFDDTAAFVAAPGADPFRPATGADAGAWEGRSAVRVVEVCGLDIAFASLLDTEVSGFDGIGAADRAALTSLAATDPAAALAAYVGLLAGDGGAYDLDDIRIAGDVLCGGPGEDAILGDQGVVVDVVEDGSRERFIRPQQPFVSTTIFERGTSTRATTLTQIAVGGDDLLLGGDGGDSLHGGAGDDLLQGGAGIDVLFGGDGDDRLWGGRGDDHLYGGYGDDHLDVRPRPATATGWGGDPAAWFLFAVEADSYQGLDQLYGGWGSDVLQADEGGNGPVDGDRLMDWGGVSNLSYVCAATYGAWITIRSPAPGLIDYILDKAEGHGAVDVRTEGSSGFNEVAMVYTGDIRNNVNPPHPETPGHFTCGSADPTRGPGGGGGGGNGGGGNAGGGNAGGGNGNGRGR